MSEFDCNSFFSSIYYAFWQWMKAFKSWAWEKHFWRFTSLLTQDASHTLSSLRQIIKSCPLQTRQWNCKMRKQTFITDLTQILLRSLFRPCHVSHCFRNQHALHFSEKQNGTERGSNKMDENTTGYESVQTTQYVIQRYSYHGINLAFSFRHLYL